VAVARELLARECPEDELALVAALTAYLRASRLHAALLAECCPTSVLKGEQLLERVARTVGLELPRRKA